MKLSFAYFTLLSLVLLLTSDIRLVEGASTHIELLVPAYANPASSGGPSVWTKLTASAAAGNVKLNIILNPGSGPGRDNDTGLLLTEIEPNYISSTYPNGLNPLLDFTNAGGVAYGYVATGFAVHPIGGVEAEIDKYYDLTYWRGAPVQVSGIFFDEMSNDLCKVGYYEELQDYIEMPRSF